MSRFGLGSWKEDPGKTPREPRECQRPRQESGEDEDSRDGYQKIQAGHLGQAKGAGGLHAEGEHHAPVLRVVGEAAAVDDETPNPHQEEAERDEKQGLPAGFQVPNHQADQD